MAEQPAPEDQAEEDQAGKERQESLWASFTRDDIKLLIITFAGTVAANVFTVVVVAIAIIGARNSSRPTLGVVLSALVMWVVGVMGVVAGVVAFRRRRPRDAMSRMMGVGATVWMGVIVLVFGLVLLGWAVGVK